MLIFYENHALVSLYQWLVATQIVRLLFQTSYFNPSANISSNIPCWTTASPRKMHYTGGTLSAKPLSAKLFRAKFNHPKVHWAQNSVIWPRFLAGLWQFFLSKSTIFALRNFTLLNIKTKTFHFELIKWKFFDFTFGRFDWFYKKLFLGKVHLAQRSTVSAKLFRAKFFCAN